MERTEDKNKLKVKTGKYIDQIVDKLLRDKQLLATENVLKQAELLADEWAAQA